jgi:hypothetical protein
MAIHSFLRPRIGSSLALVALFAIGFPKAVLANDCSAGSYDSTQSRPASTELRTGGWLRTGQSGSFAILDAVKEIAPVLRYAPKEPLFKDGILTPQSLPDDGARRNVVYFQIRTLVVEGEALEGIRESNLLCARWSFSRDAGELDARAISEVRIRFLFYYPFDVGPGGHEHDLEGIEVVVSRAIDSDSLRVSRVTGSAHGISWYANDLTVDPSSELAIPLAVFVEFGKHGSAPDRDGDGVYDPKTDSNGREPWGVRDRWSFVKYALLRGNSYHKSMTMERNTVDIGVPNWIQWDVPLSKQYELRSSVESAGCNDQAMSSRPELAKFTEYMGFCLQPTVTATKRKSNVFVRGLRRAMPVEVNGITSGGPFSVKNYLPTYTIGFDSGRVLESLLLPLGRVRLVDGWLSFRGATRYGQRFSPGPSVKNFATGDLVYSRSFARLWDVYGTVGFDSVGIKPDEPWAMEIGAKVSIPFHGSDDMITLRPGLRRSTAVNNGRPRFVLHVTAGPW